MKASRWFPHPRVVLLALVTALFVGATCLPTHAAETKSKKSTSKSAASKKKKSTSTSKAKPKASPAPKSSSKGKKTATPESKKKVSTTPAPSTPAKATPPPKAETDDSAPPASTAEPKEAAPKSSSGAGKTGASEQPAPDLPVKEPKTSSKSSPATSSGGSAPDAETSSSAKPASEAEVTGGGGKGKVAAVVSLSTEEILGFEEQPPKVKELIQAALSLTEQKLTYTYGSADPAKGGMDCSGAIHYLLGKQGFDDVPRDASGQYVWARKNGKFFAVVSKKADSFEFGDLLPGDLLFWNGTYNVDRDPPVTHTMIYLGVQKKRAQHIMWGSSDGRTYDSKPRRGVSVFDFKMPRVDKNVLEGAKADFLGYARIPGLRK